MKRALAIVLALVVALLARPAAAHDVTGEIMFLDVGEAAVGVELQIPVTQIRAVAPALFPGKDHDIASLEVSGVPALVEARLGATSKLGQPFAVDVHGAKRELVKGHDVVVVEAALHAPAGESARWFELRDDVILGKLVTDSVYVFLRRDLRSGALGEKPALLGELHYQQRTLTIDREEGGRMAIIKHAFGLGMHHIAEGGDHVLFLIMLLLAAPRLGSAAKIVTGFTVGHSITLIASTLGAFQAGAWVERAIALTILVTAVHAARPLLPRKEPYIAAAFGLIHGLAFASALTPFGFDKPTLVLSLLGFNLGVEAMQLAIVLATIPFLALLAKSATYRVVRFGGAVFGVVAALSWIAQRGAWVDAILRHGPALVGALAITAIVDRVVSARPAPSGSASRARPRSAGSARNPASNEAA